MNKNFFDEIIGWYGMGAILAAYLLVSFNYLSASGVFYQILNLTGAAGVAYISYRKKAQQPALLNVTWAIIALVAIIRIVV